MRKRIIFLIFLSIILIFVFLLNNFALANDNSDDRPLEIVYPKIPGVDKIPQTVKTGLPDYVKYIFTFALFFFGLLIFGVLIFSGINYILSAGNPAKLSEARQGIMAALLGGVILFASYLVFNTINPQLVILEAPPLPKIPLYIQPGVYLCNYKVDNIGQVLNDYMVSLPEITAPDYEEKLKKRSEAVKKFMEILGTLEDPDKTCFLATNSGPLENFSIEGQTIFIVPQERYNQETKRVDWVFNFGLVLHDDDNFTGKCKILPSPDAAKRTIYGQIDGFQAGIDFKAEAITVFKKPPQDPPDDLQDVVLYEQISFNELGGKTETTTTTQKKLQIGDICEKDEECESNSCIPVMSGFGTMIKQCHPKPGTWLPQSFFVFAAKDPNLKEKHFKVGGSGVDIKIVDKNELEELYQNTRSIQVKPRDQLLVVLFGDEDEETAGQANEKCEVRSRDDDSLIDDPIGRCGRCNIVTRAVSRVISKIGSWEWAKECHPCLEYLIIIKGQKI